ncbi:hypothetical protein L7F22_030280 [Adiantum nelumboides]|nr:hypothetical protein [Adiantum nelumboides]
MRFKKQVIWGVAAVFVAIFAVSLSSLAVKSPLCTSSGSTALCRVYHSVGFYKLAWKLKHWTRGGHSSSDKKRNVFSNPVLWMAPFLSGGGYCSEALSYVTGLHRSELVPYLSIEQHGDLANELFWRGLPAETKNTLLKSYRPGQPLNDTVVICHSEPGAWYPSLFETHTCPPTGYTEPLYVIGRTMFETDRVSAEHVRRCNLMDEIWVPTEFNMKTFADSGVYPSKLVKVFQSVDIDFFNSQKVQALTLPTGGRIFGAKNANAVTEDYFIFLSIFKWEYRKGWDRLIEAYLTEFSANDKVALYIVTNAYHSGRVYEDEIAAYVKRIGLKEPTGGWPILHVSDDHVPQSKLPSLYKAADAFVLASRGEGWGRPIVEAMSMALPVIATNWSGMTEYMTKGNSYPLHVEGLVEVEEGPFKGHLWAEPSVAHLQSLMRHITIHRAEAQGKGWIARLTMVQRFSPDIVTQEIVDHLRRIRKERAAAT